MSTILFGDLPIHVYGEIPEVGDELPPVSLVDTNLNSIDLSIVIDKPCLINVFPSIDTQVCFNSFEKVSEIATQYPNLLILCISIDTPFALARVLQAKEDIPENLLLLSDYQNRDFGAECGLVIADGPTAGCLARAVILCNQQREVLYAELVDKLQEAVNFELLEQKIKDLTTHKA